VKFRLLILLMLCSQAKANENDILHLTAHVGASYIINTIVYGVSTKMGMSKSAAFIVSAAATLAVGALYKFGEPEVLDWRRPMLENAIGVVGSDATIVLFKF